MYLIDVHARLLPAKFVSQLLSKLKDKLCQLAKGLILINTEEVSVRLLCASDARARPLFNAIVLLPKRH